MNLPFQSKWLMSVRENGSVIAGVDPQNLPDDVDIVEWCKKYIDEVAPYVAGFKLNPSFFVGKGKEEDEVNKYLVEICRQRNLISIYDRKVPEIGNTGKNIIKATKEIGYDSVTIAPFAGNSSELMDFGNQIGIGVINMGIMSNPEYLNEAGQYLKDGIPLWRGRLEESLGNASAMVLGGTFQEEKTGIDEFKRFLDLLRETEMLFLVPGLGAQGGDPEEFLKLVTKKGIGIKPERFMLSLSRELMFAENRVEMSKQLKELTFKFIKYETSELKELKNGFWR